MKWSVDGDCRWWVDCRLWPKGATLSLEFEIIKRKYTLLLCFPASQCKSLATYFKVLPPQSCLTLSVNWQNVKVLEVLWISCEWCLVGDFNSCAFLSQWIVLPLWDESLWYRCLNLSVTGHFDLSTLPFRLIPMAANSSSFLKSPEHHTFVTLNSLSVLSLLLSIFFLGPMSLVQ